MLYRTLVETHFSHCNVIWGQCNETLIDKLQLLQNMAVRVITKVKKYEDADHLKLICQLGIRNLIKLDLGIFMHKSQNKLLPETAGDFHVPADKVHSYQTRSTVSENVFLPRYDLSLHKCLSLSVMHNYGMKSQSASKRHCHWTNSKIN